MKKSKKIKYKKNTVKILLIANLVLLLLLGGIISITLAKKINNTNTSKDNATYIVLSHNKDDSYTKLNKDRHVVSIDINLKKKEKINVANTDKVVAITFDDGPSYASTQRILDILAKYNAKATFFMLGSKVASNPDMAKKVADAGHEIGNHSYSHANLIELDANGISQEIQNTNNIIQQVTGKTPTILRPPYGSYNSTVTSNTNLGIALWSVDSLDWKSRNEDAIYSQVMSTLGSSSVILFHDIYDTSADGFEKVIATLAEQGYTFLTYSELMSYKGE